jgi:hypothetical protein
VVFEIDRPISPAVCGYQEVGLPDPPARMIRRQPTSDDDRDLAFHRFGRDRLQLILRFCGRNKDPGKSLLEVLHSAPLKFSAPVETSLQLR